MYKALYKTPKEFDDILIICDDEYLRKLTFIKDKIPLNKNEYENPKTTNIKILKLTNKWLDTYFANEIPSFTVPYKLDNLSQFTKEVLESLYKIPIRTITYKDLSQYIPSLKSKKNISYQAIGKALSKNPINIIIPCHRIIGQNNKLTGYNGGIKNKQALINHELKMGKTLCKWCNKKNPLYVKYHNEEWGVPRFDDKYLFEMLVLESFQAGLSWECILNKRASFKTAYDDFEIDKVSNYNEDKIKELLNNKNIIRNKLKIKASINNAKIFKSIVKEYKSFYNYLLTFTKGQIYYEIDKTTNTISDEISTDLKKRGMKFVGSTIIYSYLQAIGIINSHEKECFLYKSK